MDFNLLRMITHAYIDLVRIYFTFYCFRHLSQNIRIVGRNVFYLSRSSEVFMSIIMIASLTQW